MLSTSLTREEAALEMGLRGHDAAVRNIMLLAGLTREDAASEMGLLGRDATVNNVGDRCFSALLYEVYYLSRIGGRQWETQGIDVSNLNV